MNLIRVLVGIADRSRYNNTTTQQNDTFFRIKVGSSDALLVSQKNTKTKNTFASLEKVLRALSLRGIFVYLV